MQAAFEEHDGGGVLFVGDDLGDLEAFEAARALRDEGVPTLLVCSGSEEQEALVELSDVVVHGPDGVLGLLPAMLAVGRPADARWPSLVAHLG